MTLVKPLVRNRRTAGITRMLVLPAVLAILMSASCAFGSALLPKRFVGGLTSAILFNASAAQAADEVHVRAHLVSESKTIKPGSEFLLGVQFDIEPGWHIYYKECGDAGMPTSIDWKLPPGFTHGDLLWEKPHKFVDSGITTYGYANKTFIATKVTAPANLPKDKPVKIDAVLTWLSCKEICLPGKGTVTLDVPVSDAEPDKANAAQFSTVGWTGEVNKLSEESGHDTVAVPANGTTGSGSGGNSGSTSSASSGSSSGQSGGPAATTGSATESGPTDAILDEIFGKKGEQAPAEGVGYYLGFALLGGLILNVMPCVLPVIAIKVMSFIEQADEEPARVRLLGLTFSAGIMSSFLALAAIVLGIRAAGQSVGWGFQFQYPGFVILMSTIVLLLSLSLFGLFYVSFNAGQDGLDKLASKEGFVGTFFKGVLATTLSTPCTAPFLGTALGFAFAQPDWVVLGIFFMSGLGMSLPYLLFTAFPQLMKFCPKPGVWMEKFKESMGFVLMATVVWLLFVLGQQVGPEGQMWASYFLLTIALSCWIISRYTDLTSSNERKIKVWTVAGVIALAGGYFFIVNQPSIALSFGGVSSKSTAPSPSTAEGIEWKPFSITALKDAVNQNKTIFLDFTADWCLTCKSNEKLFLNTAEVKNKFKELRVETMQADWTTQDPDISKILNRFGRSGVPLYVVIPAGRPKDHIVLPEVINQKLVLDALDKAGASK